LLGGVAAVVARLDTLAGMLLLAGMVASGVGVKMAGQYARVRLSARARHDAARAARRRDLS
jgi:hypothetical protein